MKKALHILLADDDHDDCAMFQEALMDLPILLQISMVHDGVDLMRFLNETEKLPDVLFLDLNMPRKTGYECLVEIKGSEKIKQLPVMIFSTLNDDTVIDILYENGMLKYFRKPNNFGKFKRMIHEAMDMIVQKKMV